MVSSMIYCMKRGKPHIQRPLKLAILIDGVDAAEAMRGDGLLFLIPHNRVQMRKVLWVTLGRPGSIKRCE